MSNLPEQTQALFLQGLRDLNTATFNSLYKNKRGPAEAIGRRLGPVATAGAGLGVAGPVGVLAGIVGQGAGGAIGRAIDRATGATQPEVLARARVLSREGQRRNLQVSPIAQDLEAEAQSAQARATTNLDAYNQMANQMGLPRGGGWAASVARTGNEFAPGFVDIEDPIRAVEDLARAGALSPTRAQELIQDRTARPTEAEMRLITDYVVSAASQMNRGAWNAPQGTQGTGTTQNASQGLPSPPVTAVGNPEAYSEKMASVSALNEAIRAQQMTPEQRAQAEAVINAKSRQDKEAALGQGTGNPAVDSLLRSAVNMTSARSRDPGAPRARAPMGVNPFANNDPTTRRTQRGGLQVNPFSGNQGRPEEGRRTPGARDRVDTRGLGFVPGTPGLVPAIRVDGKVYAGRGTHLDVLNKVPPELRPKAAADANSRGFVTEDGRFLSRRKAQDYAVDNDLIREDAPSWAWDSQELIAENLRSPRGFAQQGNNRPTDQRTNVPALRAPNPREDLDLSFNIGGRIFDQDGNEVQDYQNFKPGDRVVLTTDYGPFKAGATATVVGPGNNNKLPEDTFDYTDEDEDDLEIQARSLVEVKWDNPRTKIEGEDWRIVDQSNLIPESEAPRQRALPAPPRPALQDATAASEPLEGLPTKIASIPYPVGPDPDLRGVAEQYMADAGMPYNPARKYVRIMDKQGNSVDGRKENSEAIAKAFDALPVDNMSDPLVRASYEAVARETLAQYEALKKLGVKIEFNPEPNKDPYNGPWGAFRDFRENRHLYVFPTNDTRDPSGASYGSSGALANEDPMLRVVEGEDWGHGIPVTVNDIFRAVHDIFGHFKEGVGFRWDGEENAWRAHAAMYSPLARLAMTTETRGQNSWLNFGPHGESNRTAKTEDTVFADQKKAILPAWAHYTGAEDFLNPVNIEQLRVENNAQLPEPPKRSGRQVKGPRTQLSLPGVLTEGSPSVRDTTSVPEILNGTFSGFLIGEKFIQKSKGGKVTLPGVGEYFDSRTPRILKPTAEDMDRVINATTEEAVFQLGNARSGKGWYSESTREAIDIASARIPELKDNPALQVVFFALASFHSGGNTPREEGARAFRDLENFMDTGLFSVSPGAPSRNYTEKEANLLNHIVRKFGGVEGASEWLLSPHSQREIYDTRIQSGSYGTAVPKHLRLNSKEPMLGMFILGPKFGAYALNKSGFEEYATKDMWAYRNFFRKTGTLTGPYPVDDKGIRETPAPGEAAMLDEVFQDVSRRIGASVADTQAILWFLEQRLYRELGVPGINSYTLADGAREYLRKSE
jgi:hypothetical protein